MIWKTIEGFPDYEVSAGGQVRRATRSRRSGASDTYRVGAVLSVHTNQLGVQTVGLFSPTEGVRRLTLSRLVYTAFHGPIPEGMWVVRRDRRKGMQASNLRLATKSEVITEGIARARARRGGA